MNTTKLLLTGCALVLLGAGAAQADCAEDLAGMETTGGIAKDGTLAPLQDPAAEGDADWDAASGEAGDAAAGAAGEVAAGEVGQAGEAAEGEIAKDGTLAPLETEADAGAPAIAMSGQDAQAQQEGGAPAAEAAEAAGSVAGDGAREEALERARMALAEGDEAACAAALEEARTL